MFRYVLAASLNHVAVNISLDTRFGKTRLIMAL